MKIELIDRKRLKIHLSKQDMNDFSADFESLDYKKTETRELVCDLLRLAKIQTGFSSKDKRMVIEAFQTADSGCILYFTLVSDLCTYKKAIPAIYEFDDFELLLKALDIMFEQNENTQEISENINSSNCKTSLFLCENKYMLVFSCADINDCPNDRQLHIIEQFATNKTNSQLFISYLSEHGKLLVEETGLSNLYSLFVLS